MPARKKITHPDRLASIRNNLREKFKDVDIDEKMREMSDSSKNWLWENVKLFFILCFATIALGFLFFAIFPDALPKPSWSWQYAEEPLGKNSQLMLAPGDELEYRVDYNGTVREVVIRALPSPICRGVYLADMTSAEAAYGSIAKAASARPGEFAACVGADGNEISQDGKLLGSNVSFSNMSWPYFQPWMLALKDGFSWKANVTLQVMPTNTGMTSRLQYKTLGSKDYMGRDAFRVEVSQIGASSDFSPNVSAKKEAQEMLVDKKYRVLLYSASDRYEIRLVRAPFALKEG